MPIKIVSFKTEKQLIDDVEAVINEGMKYSSVSHFIRKAILEKLQKESLEATV